MKKAFTILTAAVAIAAAGPTLGEVKVSQRNGHYNAAIVKVTFPDGSFTRGILHSLGTEGAVWNEHQIAATSLAGTAVHIWLDTLVKITAITKDDMLVTTRSGSTRRLRYEGYHTHLRIVTADDSTEVVDIRKAARIEFQRLARRDRLGIAMLDQWLYSPNTGERLRK